MRNIDKLRGCLIGGAAGDALGYAVEFLHEGQIFSLYGNEGITEYTLRNGFARISDDTQMTLFTAEGLLLADHCADINSIRSMYKCWYRTQTEKYPLADKTNSSLMEVPELFRRRSPGKTCMSEIKKGARGTILYPANNSKGCGGLMRVAPVGLYFANSGVTYVASDTCAEDVAALTHGHDLGIIPAAALAHIVRRVTESDVQLKDAVNNSIDVMKALFSDSEYIFDFVFLMQKAVQLAETEMDDISAIHKLGEGWVAEETLAIAVYCALKYSDDFDKAMIAAVNHSGDSDSTGSVCGNILGAYLGYSSIPQKYKDHLELHDLIIRMADDLCEKKL